VGVDWADASNNNVTDLSSPLVDTALAAQRVLDSLLAFVPGIGNTGALAELPIHLIGYGRGASVMTEVAELLGGMGIWVDHLTLIDPHPLTNADTTRPGGTDPAINLTSNVLFVDNYFQAVAAPTGQSFSGAVNIDMTAFLNSSAQSHAYYHGTADLTAATDGDGTLIQSSWYGSGGIGPRNGVGMAYSRFGTVAQPAAGLLAALGGTANRPAATATAAQWPNVARVQVPNGAQLLGQSPLTVPFVFGDRDSSATVRFFIDSDTNPYNGTFGTVGTVNMAAAALANGVATLTGNGAPNGVYYLGVEVNDGVRKRFTYADKQVSVVAGFPFEAVYPEGYAGDHINEFVPITNTNNEAVVFELHARYETGVRDQLIASGTIPANTRGGVTISETRFPDATVVRKNEPYALVLRSTLPLAATFSHYDFGTTIGEAFTYTRSAEWTFGDGFKDNDVGRDYILVYNPQETATAVTLTLYTVEGITYTDTRVVQPQRRGGWSVSDISEQRLGAYSARVTATQAIVAAQSRYQPTRARGYGALGSPTGGALAGIIPTISYDDTFYDRNGDDPGQPRHPADAVVSILNTNNVPATMTLHFFVDQQGQGGPGPIPRVAIVPANGRATLNVRDLGLPDNVKFGVVYRSNIPVTVSGGVYQGQDGTGITASEQAATEWSFGEGYMSRTRAGGVILEDYYLFNPGAAELDITVQFMFTDGSVVTVVKTLDPRELEDLRVHELAAVVNRAEDQWFGVRLSASSPFVVSMEHWDGGIGGGFQTLGVPGGSIVTFASVLTL
jgi:hypothetical protein